MDAVAAKEKGFAFLQSLVSVGSSTWARTRDLRINSPALYRLSYRGIFGVVSKKYTNLISL